MDCSTPGFPVLHYLPEFAQTNIYWVSDAIQPFHPLSPSSLLSLNLCNIRVFSKWSTLCIRWPKYWSFSFSISTSNEYSGFISLRIDWFNLPAVQGMLKNLLQHHSLKTSVLQCSAFFMIQLTSIHDYWKNHSFDYMEFCVSYFGTKKYFPRRQLVYFASFDWQEIIFIAIPKPGICKESEKEITINNLD